MLWRWIDSQIFAQTDTDRQTTITLEVNREIGVELQEGERNQIKVNSKEEIHQVNLTWAADWNTNYRMARVELAAMSDWQLQRIQRDGYWDKERRLISYCCFNSLEITIESRVFPATSYSVLRITVKNFYCSASCFCGKTSKTKKCFCSVTIDRSERHRHWLWHNQIKTSNVTISIRREISQLQRVRLPALWDCKASFILVVGPIAIKRQLLWSSTKVDILNYWRICFRRMFQSPWSWSNHFHNCRRAADEHSDSWCRQQSCELNHNAKPHFLHVRAFLGKNSMPAVRHLLVMTLIECDGKHSNEASWIVSGIQKAKHAYQAGI